MNVIGRVKELDEIEQCISSGRPEFMVVYGRRRVGKTFLIKEYFNNRFSFYATGLLNGKTKSQLKIFKESLIEYGDEEKAIPKDWFEAFRRLRKVLEAPTVCRDVASGRRVIFLDEVPWMDTARSDFKAALDYFWNSWASSQKDLLLIVCGSATSWIINNILFDKGGFYNRITRQLNIKPFSLGECAEYFQSYGFTFTKKQVIDCYMVFGGIPYYFNLFDKRLSLVQNINNLVIDPQGQLHYEYEHLFSSLFKNAATHVKIISVIAEQKWGVQRTDIVDKTGISDGEGLTRALRELEQCGFIRKYKNMTSKIKGSFFQVVDPFVLFSHYYLQDDKLSYFDVMQAVPQLVESGHLAPCKGGYQITDKGRQNTAITKDSLAYPVMQRASRAVDRFNREVRRDSFVRTEIMEQPNGDALAVMHYNDEMGPLITIEYSCTSPRQATFLTNAFHTRADRIYQTVTELLTAKGDPADEAGPEE